MKIYIVTVVAWILLLSSSWKTSEAAVKTITLNLVNPSANRYSSFLTAIRDNVRDRKLNYCHSGIDVIGAPSSRDKFLRINFQHPRGTVSLGLTRANLYVVAYFAKDNEKVNRAYYFRGQITTAELTDLFREVEAKHQKELEYREDYLSLERNAKITTGDQSRKELGLGIDLLISSIDRVTMKARVVRDEARFLLIAIQMVAEAARFKYIQKLVTKNFPKKFNSENKVIQFQVNWSKISKAIYDKNTCQNNQFRTNQNFGFGPVKKVKDLEMGLLTYLGKPRFSMRAN